MNKLLAKVYQKAKAENRLCEHCKWIVTKVDHAKGYKLCAGCRDALQGVNTKGGYLQYSDESVDMTGEML